MMKQVNLLNFFGQKPKEPSSSDEEYLPSDDERKPDASSSWTRVKALDTWKGASVFLYELDKDIQADLATTRARSHISADKGTCIFDPEQVEGKANGFSLQNRHLSVQELETYATLASEVRAAFALD